MIILKSTDPRERESICGTILGSLTEWFPEPGVVDGCMATVRDLPTWVAVANNKAVGFVSVKGLNQYTAELYVMGVLREYHGKSVGKGLVNTAASHAKKTGCRLLTVKMPVEDEQTPQYHGTTRFYQAMGFHPIEVITGTWYGNGPCLLMVKIL